jgi:hypothetical protein
MEKLPENHPEKANIQEVLQSLKDILSRINEKAGQADNDTKLHMLQKHLKFESGLDQVFVFALLLGWLKFERCQPQIYKGRLVRVKIG